MLYDLGAREGGVCVAGQGSKDRCEAVSIFLTSTTLPTQRPRTVDTNGPAWRGPCPPPNIQTELHAQIAQAFLSPWEYLLGSALKSLEACSRSSKHQRRRDAPIPAPNPLLLAAGLDRAGDGSRTSDSHTPLPGHIGSPCRVRRPCPSICVPLPARARQGRRQAASRQVRGRWRSLCCCTP